MKYYFRFSSFIIVTILLVFALLAPLHSASAFNGTASLASQIAALQLGMNGYMVGARLSPAQKEASASNLLDDAYQGTYKFRDKELYVVVAQEDDTVLALYQRAENADFSQARKMISGLMGMYGEPTAMAHDKMIYWAYDSHGKISEENYNDAKEHAGQLNVLATVKFNSDFAVTGEEPEGKEKGSMYFIVSSDQLTEEFMKEK